MTINQLTTRARNKDNFTTLQGYIDFCQHYLDFVAAGHLQAVIVSQNENHYRFWQYDETAGFQITRPINSQLMYQAAEFGAIRGNFISTLQNLRDIEDNAGLRSSLNNTVYSIQQSIGAALDGLPAGESNTARKINGDLFERLMQLILQEMGVAAVSGTVRVPVVVDGVEQFKMNYQHDLIISYEGDVKAIGSVKTTSKDRIDKIFMDKFLYSKITGSDLPHIAIFLNDVQRKGTAPKYGISSTFLLGHFKGYTVKLNPLDGVYYCDIRPNMKTEPIVKDHIKTLDHLLCTDIWSFLRHEDAVPLEITPTEE
ncbi:hypothetical protein [Hymenobacter psoromatis]|uniref:hypothetical protein n=1 Tax=Hymenobacter psoromatis TaxID=1484116 RepID=UPI001CBCFA13|nr:hypothetical protein [Hymenobacter psoromatis]